MRDGDASPAYLRLMELDEAAGDWRGCGEECPAPPGRQSADPGPVPRARPRRRSIWASRDEAVGAYRALALLDDTDPAGVHYHLAKLAAPGRASRRRPGARSSSRWRKRLASARPISFCSSWSNMTRRSLLKVRPFPVAEVTRCNDTKTSDTLAVVLIAAGHRRRRRARTARRPVSAASARRVRSPTIARGVPDWKVDEHFKNDVFTFVRVRI